MVQLHALKDLSIIMDKMTKIYLSTLPPRLKSYVPSRESFRFFNCLFSHLSKSTSRFFLKVELSSHMRTRPLCFSLVGFSEGDEGCWVSFDAVVGLIKLVPSHVSVVVGQCNIYLYSQ